MIKKVKSGVLMKKSVTIVTAQQILTGKESKWSKKKVDTHFGQSDSLTPLGQLNIMMLRSKCQTTANFELPTKPEQLLLFLCVHGPG